MTGLEIHWHDTVGWSGEATIARITVATMVSKHRSSFEVKCAQCDNEVIVPEWSEYRNKRYIRHLWHCWSCDYCFETIVNTKLMEDEISPLPSVA
jgi:hypothetical protein